MDVHISLSDFAISKLTSLALFLKALQPSWSLYRHTSSYTTSQIPLPSSQSKNEHGSYIDSNIKVLKVLVKWLLRLRAFTLTM